jgi:hypothetical protein
MLNAYSECLIVFHKPRYLNQYGDNSFYVRFLPVVWIIVFGNSFRLILVPTILHSNGTSEKQPKREADQSLSYKPKLIVRGKIAVYC